MEDDALTGLQGGWTLIAITNGKSTRSKYDMPFTAAEPRDAFTGHYTKDLTGRSFTAQRFECGTSVQGVKGSMVDTGSFSWAGESRFSATIKMTKTNAVWKPRLPGDSSGSDSDTNSAWTNHYSRTHHPNFGITGFQLVDGRSYGDSRYCFSCNPQSNAFGSGDATWYSGASGTRFVRYWLR